MFSMVAFQRKNYPESLTLKTSQVILEFKLILKQINILVTVY